MTNCRTKQLVGLLAVCLLGTFCLEGRSEPVGPYPVGWVNVEIPGVNGPVPATIHYPALQSGPGTPLHDAEAAYPVVSFAHGWLLPVGFYASTLSHMASYGHVVIAIDAYRELFPSVDNYATDLQNSFDYLIGEGQRPGSLFHQRIRSEDLGILAHSLGGTAAIMAAVRDSRIQALALWAPADPDGIETTEWASQLQIPVQILTGSYDLSNPLLSEIVPLFLATPPPSQIIVLWGGTHWGYLDLEDQVYFFPTAAMGAVQLQVSHELARSFLDLHLRGDNSAWDNVWGPSHVFRQGMLVYMNPGLYITPYPLVSEVVRGGTAVFDVQLVSTAPRQESYEIFVGAEAGTLFVSPETVSLAPGETKWVELRVTIPPNQPPGDIVAYITARSTRDQATRAYTFSTARVLGP